MSISKEQQSIRQRERRRNPEYKAREYERQKAYQDKINRQRIETRKREDTVYGCGVYVLSNGDILKPGKFSVGNKTNRLSVQKRKRGVPILMKCYLDEEESTRLERLVICQLAPWKIPETRSDLFIDCEDSRSAIYKYFGDGVFIKEEEQKNYQLELWAI